MGLGGFFAEAFGGGLIFSMINRVVGILSGIFTDKFREGAMEKINKVIDTKSLEDEHYFALALAEAVIDPAKRKIFNQGVLYAEEYDKKNGTMIARNFRIIVTHQDKDKENKEKVGKKIIEQIAESCANEAEIFMAIQLVGAEHGPALSLERAMCIGKSIVWPFLRAKAMEFHGGCESKVCLLEAFAQKQSDDYAKRSFWSKLFLN